ncbi:hypothetical protein PA10_00035 [Pseudomonas phage pPa_SNUABM_DT01]|nr:hypothetical protein PA10_00035 [Pseudomonas phage pPa_SNUABM_DT01]
MSTLYQIYHESVVRLAATMVVKDEATCEIINSRLSIMGHEVLAGKPETWKYYLNLAGQYHSTDTPMKVTSMDTHEEIDFTRENMDIHRATWREYQYDSRYYRELIARYPHQDMLIHGILYPVDMAKAIAAPDHSILYYDPSLVESRETNLIPQLQEWINGLFIRWAADDYRINNSMFIAARLGVMFMAMGKQIKSIRLDNCRTEKVHSYHIRRYLASFGPLDQYYNEMNEFQRLYFYRNIRYIMRNNGKDEIFRELVEQVMTKRNFPVAEYTLQQQDEAVAENYDPEIQYFRSSINGIPSALGEDIKNTRQMLDLQRTLARSNLSEQEYAEEYIPTLAARSLNAEVETKTLESNVLDLKESEPYTLSEVLLNQWIYFADKGLYRTVLTLQMPNGGESFKLSMKEAYIVYQYLYMLRLGVEMVEIPRIMAKRVRRMPLPTFEELRSITTREVTSDAFINEALKDNVVITNYVSVDSFLKACQEIQARMLLHRDLYVFREDLLQYAEIQLMTNRFYADIPVDMDHGQNYSQWLRDRGLSFENYTPSELDEIMLGILNQATGLSLRTAMTLKDIQRAMLNIMSQLSSYSIQFIQQINEEAVMMFDWPHIRWHNQGGISHHHMRLPVTLAVPLDFYGKAKWKQLIDLSGVSIRAFDQHAAHDMEMQIGLDWDMSGMNQYIERGVSLGTLFGAITQPTVDLTTLNGKVAAIPSLQSKPIADLFDRTETDAFTNP